MRHRNRRSIALAIGAGATGLLLLLVIVTWNPFDGADAIVVHTGGGAELEVVWAGDTMLGDAAEPVIAERGYDWPLAQVKPLLEADAAVVNGEAPITSRNVPFSPEKDFSYAVDPAAAPALADAGVTALGLANNHSMDEGPEGLADTRQLAEDAGMASFGAGRDSGAAERPLLIEGEAGTVGVVAMGKDYGRRTTAGDGRAGTSVFSDAAITRGYDSARAAGADWVVAFVHWGENYQDVLPQQRLLAESFAAAGYDLVIGAGPHVVQGVEYFGSVPVFYSLGNLVFNSPGRFTDDQEGYGLVVRTVFSENGLSDLRVTCIVTDNDRIAFQPRTCSAVDARAVLRRLHERIEVNGSTGRLDVGGRG
jgi:poly-gamma-glutamate capsule biosynthesis protein CapA/YwtB (metallophosphatase superfamily)